MQEHGGCLENIQQDAISKWSHLECNVITACEMWARGEGTGTISTNATGSGAAISCHFCGGAECMCKCSYT
jgi:hypothetical protein